MVLPSGCALRPLPINWLINGFGLLTVVAANPATAAADFTKAAAIPVNFSETSNCNVSFSSSDPELVSATAGADVDWAGSENAAACGSSKGWHELSVFWLIPVVAVIFWRDGFFQLGKGQMLQFTYCNFDGE